MTVMYLLFGCTELVISHGFYNGHTQHFKLMSLWKNIFLEVTLVCVQTKRKIQYIWWPLGVTVIMSISLYKAGSNFLITWP